MTDTSTVNTDAPTQLPKSLKFEFRGKGIEYFKIWIVNILLTMLTLGIYSAWATVRNNRYFYSNLYLDNINFRYLAQPMAILKGRLIAMAAFIAYGITSQVAPMLYLALTVALIIAIPYFINQSLSFDRRMTSYNNIQFRFKATYGEAFMATMIWPLLGVLSIGILYPLAFLKINQYMVKNSAYGTSNFDFKATYGDYGMIFLAAIGTGLVIGLPISLIMTFAPALAVITPVLIITTYVGILLFFIVQTNNLFFNKLNLKEHTFNCNATIGSLGTVILINTLLTIVTLGLYLPAAKVRITKYWCSCIVMKAIEPLDSFVAAEKENVSALGEEFGQVFDFAS